MNIHGPCGRYLPRAHAQGAKVIVRCRCQQKEIARSRHLGTLATRKHDKSVEFGEKLALLCFEWSGMAYKRHK